jgi:hypothetical protein
MEVVLNRFKELYQERFRIVPSTSMGEDSIRYDFFLAVQEVMNIPAHKIQLEYPLHRDAFIPRNDPRSYRKEKPQIDLWIDEPLLKACFEFGLFKQNSNINGNINKTDRIFKMLSDFLRLSLQSFYCNCDAYFICVADKKIINHQLRNKYLPPFPGQEYSFNSNELDILLQSTKSNIDSRFLEKFRDINLKLSATKIFDEIIYSEINSLETHIIAWKVKSTI